MKQLRLFFLLCVLPVGTLFATPLLLNTALLDQVTLSQKDFFSDQTAQRLCCSKLFFNLSAPLSDSDNQERLDVLQQLAIIQGEQGFEQRSLCNAIDRTVTACGYAALVDVLSGSVNNVAAAQKRQQVVKNLVQDPDLYKKIDSFVRAVQTMEQDMLSFWLQPPCAEHLYFEVFLLKHLNSSPKLLEAYHRASLLFDPSCEINFVIWMLAALYVAQQKVSEDSFIGSCWQACGSIVSSLFWPLDDDNVKQLKTCFQVRGMWKYPALAVAFTGGSFSVWPKMKTCFSQIPHMLMTGWTQRLAVVGRMRKQLATVRTFVECAADVAEVTGCSDVQQAVSALHDQEATQEFIDLLYTDTFLQEEGLFCYMGRVLYTHKKMEACKNNFVPLLRAVGELDLCLSLAKLYKEHEYERLSYSFVTFVKQKEPYLAFDNVWSPLICAKEDNIVANNLELGAPGEHKNMVITGSNKNGKTTLLRSVGCAVLLAQTCGLVPASNAILTPFSDICVALECSDSVARGVSSWQAACMRAAGLIKRVAGLRDNHKALVLVDELFKTGTTDIILAQQEAVRVAGMLQDLPALCLFATHMKPMTTLEKSSGGIFKNYMMDAEYDGKKYVYPHTLHTGVSSVSTAAAVLDDELSAQIKTFFMDRATFSATI